MAEHKSTLLEPSARANPKPISASQFRGRYRIAKGSFTGDAAQNDTVDLMKLPPHATLSHVISRLRHTAFGAGVLLDIGVKADPAITMANGDSYAGDPDCIADGLAIGSAGTKTFFDQAGVADFDKQLWQIAGIDSGAPKRDLTITGTFLGADPAEGTLGFEQGWAAD